MKVPRKARKGEKVRDRGVTEKQAEGKGPKASTSTGLGEGANKHPNKKENAAESPSRPQEKRTRGGRIHWKEAIIDKLNQREKERWDLK